MKRHLETSGYFLQPPVLPQVLPLTAGEVLGCTAPRLRRAPAAAGAAAATPDGNAAVAAAAGGCGGRCGASEGAIEALATTGRCGGAPAPSPGGEAPEISTVVFLADGRFHLEASMIQNPGIQFIRYDPFTKARRKP